MFKSFSHIYVEREIKDHARTLSILSHFKSSVIIEIDHYKDIFNRRGQNFREQKLSQKLVLAKRKDQFLYEGSHFSPSFDAPNFYYNTLALNCLYDCDYCYLQGMFSSANLVMFVNWEDYFDATDAFLKSNQSLYLAISYDTDLLATESFFEATNAWINFARSRSNLLLEIRTKSSNFQAISAQLPIDNAILAWTISPDSICKTNESKTPNLKARLTAIKSALSAGWKVRICIDPILKVENWKEKYQTLIDQLDSEINLNQLYDISFGTFRMNSEFLNRIQQIRQDSSLIYYPFERKNQITTYSSKENEEIIQFFLACFHKTSLINFQNKLKYHSIEFR